MIGIKDFSFGYKEAGTLAINQMQLEISEGDFVGVIGPSGAGKSTLVYAINGVVPHHYNGDYYGSVKVAGKDVFEEGISNLALSVGTVFQDIDAQMVTSMVEDEILFGLENFGVPRDEIEERIESALEMVGIKSLRDRKISSLSGGQKQKVALATVIAIRPQIMILDEPTGELDPKSSKQIFEVLKMLNETQGMTIVVVEQKIMLLCEYVKKLLVMKSGSVQQYGTVKEVLSNPEGLKQVGINCPRVVDLCYSLKRRGLTEGEVYTTVEETAELVRGLVE